MNTRRSIRFLPFFLILALLSSASSLSALEIEIVNITNKKDPSAETLREFAQNEMIWIFFNISDFALDEKRQCHLVQHLKIVNMDGDVIKEYPALLVFKEKVPETMNIVKVNNSLDLSVVKLKPGTYTALITVIDKLGNDLSVESVRFKVLSQKKESSATQEISTDDLYIKQGKFLKISDPYFSEAEEAPPKPVPKFAFGQRIFFSFTVTGCQPGKDGRCHLTEDFAIVGPGNVVVLKKKNLLTFRDRVNEEEPISFQNNFYLKKGADGDYYAVAFVYDHISGDEAQVSQRFTLKHLKIKKKK